jgi:ankyrin repeat protein
MLFGLFISQLGITALMLAAHKGLTDCVRLLLEHGADKDAKGNVRLVDFIILRPSSVFVCASACLNT